MGLNEFAGYLAVSGTLLASGYVAAAYALRPEPFYLGMALTAAGLGLSAAKAKETREHALLEARLSDPEFVVRRASPRPTPPSKNIFLFTTLRDRALSVCCLAGLVNNLIFGMSWGLFPLFYAANGLDVDAINLTKAFYPGVWGVLQLGTGVLSDRVGRKWLIVGGQLVQAAGLWLTVSLVGLPNWILASALLGVGTALVYPALLAAVSDIAHPTWRGAALGTYRFWRDAGYAVGAVVAGTVADFFGIPAAISAVSWLALGSAGLVALRMYETLRRGALPPVQG